MRTDAQLASAYLLKAWRRATNFDSDFPPTTLISAVVVTVLTVGYTKKVVDDLVQKYLEANPR